MKTAKLYLLIFSIALAGDAGQPWKTKPAAEWAETDARQVLSDSPWAKPVTARFDRSGGDRGYGGRSTGTGGLHGEIGGTIGTGGRRGAGGAVGGGFPPGRGDGGLGGGREPEDGAGPPRTVIVRWESALPVREAQLKLAQVSLAADDPYYAVAIVGLPAQIANRDPQGLRSQAWLKPKGKKRIAPADVKVMGPDDSPVLLILFPKTIEITQADKEVEFSAHVHEFEIRQKFALKEMIYLGKLEL